MWQHADLGYWITTDVDTFDMDFVHEKLSGDAYWSKGIPRDTLEKAFRNSLSFGLFAPDKSQVGMARMVTDRATFAYLADVYVSAAHRGKGLGDFIMQVIMAHPDLQGLRRMMLATSDMHPLYRKYGFSAIGQPDILMEQVVPDIYQRRD